ncbi:hypothetical protein EVAR_16326_1 [Eumeta japonica]|uniref:Uncharacterized protein n=1 Tax=Eumeta variegata TaxID=151549 RepID=A0A4C1VG48_EUMVA|nr:hypothetical protein EVAR_16326_1 [Eumeta japonica]
MIIINDNESESARSRERPFPTSRSPPAARDVVARTARSARERAGGHEAANLLQTTSKRTPQDASPNPRVKHGRPSRRKMVLQMKPPLRRHPPPGPVGAASPTRRRPDADAICCARGRPIIVEWERDARHSAGLSRSVTHRYVTERYTFQSDSQPQPNLRRCHVKKVFRISFRKRLLEGKRAYEPPESRRSPPPMDHGNIE